MSRFKLMLLCALAVMAVGGVASTSASAQRAIAVCWRGSPPGEKFDNKECNSHNQVIQEWGWWRLEEGRKVKVIGSSGVSKLQSELDGVALTIECKKDKFSGTLDEVDKNSGTVITYEECALTGGFATKCEVSSTLTTDNLKGELTSGTRIENTFEPEGSAFIEIEIKAKSGKTCAIAATYPIKGSQTCEIDKDNAEAEEGKEEHEIICKTSGSNLKLGPESATYEGSATVKPEGGEYWKVE